jgi:hypothetical protein
MHPEELRNADFVEKPGRRRKGSVVNFLRKRKQNT